MCDLSHQKDIQKVQMFATWCQHFWLNTSWLYIVKVHNVHSRGINNRGSLVPRLFWRGEKRAWLSLSAHARKITGMTVIHLNFVHVRKIPTYSDITFACSALECNGYPVWQRYFIRPEVSQKPRTDTEDRAESICEAHLEWEGCFCLAADRIRQVFMLQI